jgi:hypothetical protein
MPTPRPPLPEDKLRRWSTRDLRSELAISDSVFRRLQRVGLLSKPSGRGRGITYSDVDRIRALAALRLKHTGTSFTKSARLLATGSWEQTRQLAGFAPPEPPPAAPSAVATPSPAPTATRRTSLWSRVELEPGIELHINLATSTDPERLTRLLQALAGAK